MSAECDALERDILLWLYQENLYLWELERRLHYEQRENRRKYIKTLQWLLEESRNLPPEWK
jgi:hypothetical protein